MPRWGVLFDGISHQVPDIDPAETAEWLDSFDALVEAHGRPRARFLLMTLLQRARTLQVDFPATVSTPYVNTIPADAEPWFPGNEYVERRIRAYIRWNAAAMVTRANSRSEGIGGPVVDLGPVRFRELGDHPNPEPRASRRQVGLARVRVDNPGLTDLIRI